MQPIERKLISPDDPKNPWFIVLMENVDDNGPKTEKPDENKNR